MAEGYEPRPNTNYREAPNVFQESYVVTPYNDGSWYIDITNLGLASRPAIVILQGESEPLILQYDYDNSTAIQVKIFIYGTNGAAKTYPVRFGCTIIY